MMRTGSVAVVIFALAVAGCGNRGGLEPPPGELLPPAPYGKDYRPTAERLLEPPSQAVPERSVELRRRSEEREDDPFDLPPPEDDPIASSDAATGTADQSRPR